MAWKVIERFKQESAPAVYLILAEEESSTQYQIQTQNSTIRSGGRHTVVLFRRESLNDRWNRVLAFPEEVIPFVLELLTMVSPKFSYRGSFGEGPIRCDDCRTLVGQAWDDNVALGSYYEGGSYFEGVPHTLIRPCLMDRWSEAAYRQTVDRYPHQLVREEVLFRERLADRYSPEEITESILARVSEFRAREF